VKIQLMILVLVLATMPALSQDSFPQLLANKPSAEHREKLMLFGQLVGSWSYEGVSYNDDGSREANDGEIHIHWILDGQAIQDVWMDKARDGNPAKAYGTTVRFYDPKSDTWLSTWISPSRGAVFQMTARKVGSEIVIEGKNPSGTLIHWVFSDIKSNSFHWHAEKLVSGKWHTYEDISVKRIKYGTERGQGL
jgi:hypothetical protein